MKKKSLHSLSYPPKPILSEENATAAAEKPKHVLIYFITGNPGLIDYYAPFLSHLRELLDAAPSLTSTRFHIYGQDLAGFSDDSHEPFTSSRPPYTLEQQIQLALETVRSMRVDEPGGLRHGEPYDDVLLVGHSVGSYISLQLCHRMLKTTTTTTLSPPLLTKPIPEPKLEKAILLFPTVVHIARSPSGQRVDGLRRVPFAQAHAHRLARLFLAFWPLSVLLWFLRSFMGFPPHGADVTARWLKSRDGIWQALYMGLDEMRVIGEDVWDEELWGIERDAQSKDSISRSSSSSSAPAPKFYFFFGKDDHWVANHYRDLFIEKRQRQVERTRLIVDEEGSLPHAFCIRHSETVAEKVYTWIQEMYGS